MGGVGVGMLSIRWQWLVVVGSSEAGLTDLAQLQLRQQNQYPAGSGLAPAALAAVTASQSWSRPERE